MNSQRRGPIAAEFSGPGPAAIALPTLFGSKIFKYFADKFTQFNFIHNSSLPFPQYCSILDANIRESNKLKSPSFSFGLKNKAETVPVAPSPNTYNTSGLTAKG